MELKKAEYVARWVFPIEKEPETGIQLRRLKDSETTRIYDRHGYVPNQTNKGAMTKMTAVLKDIVKASVLDWKGFQEGGVDVPCTDEFKDRLLDVEIEGADGERQTLWTASNKAFEEAEKADRKN